MIGALDRLGEWVRLATHTLCGMRRMQSAVCKLTPRVACLSVMQWHSTSLAMHAMPSCMHTLIAERSPPLAASACSVSLQHQLEAKFKAAAAKHSPAFTWLPHIRWQHASAAAASILCSTLFDVSPTNRHITTLCMSVCAAPTFTPIPLPTMAYALSCRTHVTCRNGSTCASPCVLAVLE